MVVHLWGKFWMAAWRGRRAITWITGAICFLASIGTAFTGYVMQTNFDSQWISSEAKDGLNSVGIGAWFNVLNLGQMLLWHVVLLPLAVGAIVVWHVLLIRKRGVVPPLDAQEEVAMTTTQSPARRSSPQRQAAAEEFAARPWSGAEREYDLVKEFVVAVVVVGALVIGLAAIFSSPDEKSLTVQAWAQQTPNDFVATAAAELAGTSVSESELGAPYNSTGGNQKLGPLGLQKAAGIRIPVDSVNDFVITPLSSLPPTPALSGALSAWKAAAAKQQQDWAGAYADALAKAPDGDPAKVAAGDYGPVPVLSTSLLGMARGGGLQSVIQGEGAFYNTDYTKSVLFLADGAYLEDHAVAQHLGGDQWGMMNFYQGPWEPQLPLAKAARYAASTRSGTRSSRSSPPLTPMRWSGA